MRNDAVFWDDDDSVADEIKRVVHVLGFAGGGDGDVVSNAGVLVDDCVLDACVLADAAARAAYAFAVLDGGHGFIIIATQRDHTAQFAARADQAADADDAIVNPRVIDDATIGHHRMINLRAVDLRAGQKARARKHRRAHVKEIETRQFGSDVQVRLEKRADGPDVLPIALVHIGKNAMGLDGVGDDVFSKICMRVIQQLHQDFAVEHINAHRRQEQFAFFLDFEFPVGSAIDLQRIQHRRFLRFFHEPRDAPLGIDLHDAQCFRFRAPHRDGRDGEVGAGLHVLVHDAAEIHPIKLVAAQDEQIFEIMVQDVNQIFAHGIGGTLIPRRIGKRLFGGKYLDEPAAEMVELVRLRDVAMQGSGVELRQQINAAQAGIDAVGDRDVHKAIFAGERHSGFGAFLGEREKPLALPPAHDDGQDVAGVDGLPDSLWNHKKPFRTDAYLVYNL